MKVLSSSCCPVELLTSLSLHYLLLLFPVSWYWSSIIYNLPSDFFRHYLTERFLIPMIIYFPNNLFLVLPKLLEALLFLYSWNSFFLTFVILHFPKFPHFVTLRMVFMVLKWSVRSCWPVDGPVTAVPPLLSPQTSPLIHNLFFITVCAIVGESWGNTELRIVFGGWEQKMK